MTAGLRVSDLAGGYGGDVLALRDVSFTLPPGTITAVLGPNGGGKTTLFRALLGELPVHRGEIALAQAPAYVPQTDRTRLDYPVSALDVVLMGAYARTPWYRRIARADRDQARELLARVGLADRADTRFGALSGGQRQRVLVARALLQDTAVLLFDEPLTGMDAVSAAGIERVFGELQSAGRTLLVATHDVGQARAADLVLCLNGRQIAFGEPAAVLSAEVLQSTYGGELILVDGNRTAVTIAHHTHHH